MTNLPKPEVIFTHESDLDGFVSGLLLQRLARAMFDEDIPVEAYHYQGWKMRDLRENNAWVADMTFDSRLDRSGWVVIDHHNTDTRPTRAVLIHDAGKSAGRLCYELCRERGLGSPELDRLVHLNDVGDLFLENDPDFVLANDYTNLVKTYGFWNLHAVSGGRLEGLLNHPLLEVMAVKRRIEDPMGYEWSIRHIQSVTQEVGYVETVVGNTNVIVHSMLERGATPYAVLCTLFRKANSQMVVSFRSRNGEALKVASRLQGGGHPNAAGTTLPRSVKSAADAIDYLRSVLDPSPEKNAGINNLESLLATFEARR